MLPRRAQKSGTGQSALLAAAEAAKEGPAGYPTAGEYAALAADVSGCYSAGGPAAPASEGAGGAARPGGSVHSGASAAGHAGGLVAGLGENLDALIDRAREDMERAAKSLDFLAAARFRDRMYELQKLRDENRR